MVLYGIKAPCSHVKINYFTTTLLEYTSFVVSTLMMYNPGCVKFRAEAEEVKILPFPTVRHTLLPQRLNTCIVFILSLALIVKYSPRYIILGILIFSSVVGRLEIPVVSSFSGMALSNVLFVPSNRRAMMLHLDTGLDEL